MANTDLLAQAGKFIPLNRKQLKVIEIVGKYHYRNFAVAKASDALWRTEVSNALKILSFGRTPDIAASRIGNARIRAALWWQAAVNANLSGVVNINRTNSQILDLGSSILALDEATLECLSIYEEGLINAVLT